jgi:hypothetical protein
MEQMRAEAVAYKVQAAVQAATQQAAVSDDELTALQTRLVSLHAAKLLQDEELFVLEDLIADFVELGGTVTKEMLISTGAPAFEAAAKLHKLVLLSEKMPGDAAFARQARRKFAA